MKNIVFDMSSVSKERIFSYSFYWLSISTRLGTSWDFLEVNIFLAGQNSLGRAFDAWLAYGGEHLLIRAVFLLTFHVQPAPDSCPRCWSRFWGHGPGSRSILHLLALPNYQIWVMGMAFCQAQPRRFPLALFLGIRVRHQQLWLLVLIKWLDPWKLWIG